MIHPVAVESNRMKPLNSTLALGFYPWVSTEGRAKWLFLCPFISTVPHTLISAPDCGSVGGKRFTLTQGGRVHEGSAPSDKRPCRLIVNRGNYGIVGSINKAAELYTGVCPIQDNPTRLKVGTPTNHHPYRSPCIV